MLKTGSMIALALALALVLAASPLLANTPAGDARQQANEARERANGEFILKHYPRRALDAGEQGLVRFRVTLDQKGELTGCDVTGSSGYSRLDVETCELIQRYAKFTQVVNSEGRAVVATRNGYVNWQLPAGMLPTIRPRPDKVAGVTEQMICRRGLRTGSLVATERRCMRAGDWLRMTGYEKERIRELQGSKGAKWTAD